MKRLALLLLVACHAPAKVPDVTMPPVPPLPPKAGPPAIAQPQLVPTPIAGDPLKATVHRLKNGMTVYLATDRAQPTVTAHITVRAGSTYEPHASTGLAHYLEHMLFKGTETLGTTDYAQEKPHLDKIAELYKQLRKPGSGAEAEPILAEIDRETQIAAKWEIPSDYWNLYQRLGATEQNAFTHKDYTQYLVTIPKNRIAQWARVEADRFAHPVFRMFWTELEAVYEEKNLQMDNPEDRTEEAMMAALYPRNGYGQSAIGEIDHLKKPAYQDMVEFFERYYTPQNMAISLAGDVDESVLPLLDQAFAGFTRAPGRAHETRPTDPLNGRQELAVVVPSQEGIWLAWQAVKASDPDADAIAVMDALLMDDQHAGLLQRDLLQDQKVANASSSPNLYRDVGDYTIYLDALKDQTLEQLEQLGLAVVGKLQRGEFTDEELATAKVSLEIDDAKQIETNPGRAWRMEHSFIVGREWQDAATRLARLRAITKQDVMRAATRFLGPNYLVVKRVRAESTPLKITKPKITPIQLEPRAPSQLSKDVLAMTVEPLPEPPALTGFTRTGDVISVANPTNQLGSIALHYEYGRLDDRLACFALSLLPHAGAPGKSAGEVFRALHAKGLAVTVDCDRTRSTITLAGLDANLDAGMALLRAQLADPKLDAPTVAQQVALAKTERAAAIEDPEQVALALHDFALHDKQSEFLVVPTTAQLAAAKPDQLARILRGYLDRAHRTVYFGNRGDVAALVQLGAAKQKAPTRAPLALRAGKAIFATDLQEAHTRIWTAWPRGKTTPDERALGRVFTTYLGWLLWDDVRDVRGLAYDTDGGYEPGERAQDPASGWAFVATQRDKAHDALDAVLHAADTTIDEARLQRAKTELAESYRAHRLRPREVGPQLIEWEDEGETGDPRADRAKRVATVTAQSLEAWRKAVVVGPKIIAIAGDTSQLDPAKLKALAPAQTIQISQLFGY